MKNPAPARRHTPPEMTSTRLPIALLLAALTCAAHAATLRVGPGEAVTRIADAAKLAKDGDRTCLPLLYIFDQCIVTP